MPQESFEGGTPDHRSFSMRIDTTNTIERTNTRKTNVEKTSLHAKNNGQIEGER